ncbi:MAG: DUF4082 domain-containing protein [Acidobacteria bacterium]|nr:DUF4082 domain-containing protein [Acidobacteriota bacterium]
MRNLYRTLAVMATLFLLLGLVSVPAAAQSCPCSIWSPSATPSVADSGDPSPGEYGVRFRADVDGSVTGIRFYKSAANTGTHTGSLWSNTGTLLATATFTSESGSGWQQVNFSTPVAVTAGTTYVASYFTPTGHYSYDTSYFSSNGTDNPPLHALVNGLDGANAVFAYNSTSIFPTSSYSASNYWVDVVFTTTAPAAGPVVTSFSPANGLASVNTSAAVTATFNGPVDSSTVNNNTFQLLDASNNVVAASVTYNSTTYTATLQPSSALNQSTNYTAIVKGGSTDPRIKNPTGTAMGANVTWSFATVNPPGACPCTVWTSSATPAAVDSNDPSSGEFGVRFRSDLNGYITGIRFYKSAANTGTHIGNLWSNDGSTLLATATFSNESASGWQQVNFSSPVAVTAGTTYVASYFTPTGHYSFDSNYFTSSATDNAPLHALANGTDGNNGVFGYGSVSAFPTSFYGAANYWVDVVFNTTIATQPPVVTSFTPANGSSGVNTGVAVTATFNKAIDPSSLTSSSFVLLDSNNSPVGASLAYNSSTLTATLQPNTTLAAGAAYTAIVRGGGVKDTTGTALAASVSWSFNTASSTQAPVVTGFTPANGASGVSNTSAVTVSFSKAIDPTTLNGSTFQLFDASNNQVAAAISYNTSTLTASLQPTNALAVSSTYSVVVRGGTADPRVKDTSGTALASNITWTFTTNSVSSSTSGCPCTIWNQTSTPVNVDSNESTSVELGVKFKADVDGLITGIRYYKGVNNQGTHVGNLWTTGGSLLATATGTGETASGWQQIMFNTPVSITAGTTYVASYFAPDGHYAFDQNAFTTGIDNPPVHILSSAAAGGNGVYNYGASSTFPNQSYNASNYWVDIIYIPNNSTNPPRVIATTPATGSTGVSIGTSVSAQFNEPIDATTLNTSTFVITDASNNVEPGTVSFVSSSSTVTFKPTGSLVPTTTYTATLTTGVKDIFGNALAAPVSWTFTTAAAPANSGPGGPILVISSAANPFSRYYGEILYTEGLNAFTVQDISTVTASTLTAYDTVILGDISLTSSNVSMLTSWVNGGGRLIAMHPDKQLAGLLGLTATSNTLSDQYLLVNNAYGPGVGIVGETIQFHGTADLYTLNGATSFATLYSSASTPTTSPAVTWVNAGAGQAAAFTYDLARSVVYTRQGNPAWSGQDRDGYIDPAVGSGQIRSDDLYWGNATFDPQPNYVDLNKVQIPQADEQQRLLTNLIQQMNQNKKPLPRFWYFPSGFKAVVIMTGDDHNVGGTSGRFNKYIAASASGCSVADWQCVRATSYVFPLTPIPDYASYVSQGFEIANHTDNSPTCTNFTPASLESAITAQLAEMALSYPSNPVSKTSRTHCVLWSDYDTEPQILLNHGVRFDTSYYYWPDPFVQGRSGVFTGSGMPMRFADRNGNTFDVFQATTQMPDEDTWDYDPAISTLLDNALGSQGYYGAFTMNMHTDQAESAGSDAIVDAAQARSVPIVSSLQMLTWLDGRNASSFSNFGWNGSTLTFTLNANSAARNLQAMLPVNSSAGTLISLTRGSTSVSYTTQVIKGLTYAVFTGTAGSYSAKYGAGGAYSISGTLTGPGAIGATVKVTGTSTATVTSDPSGNYFISGLANGTYTVTPTKSAYTFSPTTRSVSISGAAVTGVNFSSVVTPTYTVSGSISGLGGPFAAVKLSNSSNTYNVVADSAGNFIFNGVFSGTYTLTPSTSGYSFSPTTRSVTVSSANVSGLTFTSAVVTSSVVAQDTVVYKDSASSSTTITTPAFSTTLANELLLAFVAGDNSGSGPNTTVTGLSGAGVTWVLVQRTNAQLGTAEIWRAMASQPLNNATVTATFSVPVTVSSLTIVSFSGVDFSGTNGSGAIGAVGSGNDDIGAPIASLVTTRNNSWVYGVGYDWDSDIARTPGTNQSIVHQYLPANNTFWVQKQNSAIATKGTTVTIDDSAPTSDRYNLSIVEILPIAPKYNVSGTISGGGGNGATVTASGDGSATATADSSGAFTLTGLAAGNYTITPSKTGYTFSPTSRSVTVSNANITGQTFTSTAVAVPGFSPVSLTFADQLINTSSATQSVVLTNAGAASMTISSTSITGANSGDFSRTTTCGSTLAVNASCTFTITFRPTASGARTANLSVSDNAPGSPHTVVLSGNGTAPIASLSPTSVAFGVQAVNTTSPASTVTLTNTGTASLTISSTSITGTNSTNFARTTTCGSTLAVGASCTFNVTFTPSASGSRSASLSVSDSASGSPHTVALTGTGTGVAVTPTSIAFGNQNLATTSSAQVVTLRNVGTSTLTGISTSFTGSNTSDFARTTTCGTSLAANASCTISVTFTPTAIGARSATLRIANSDPTSPQQVTLTGTGLGATASLSASSVAFGNQQVNTNSSTRSVTLTNNGNANLTINSTSITGTNSADFTRTTTCGSTLAAGSSCTFTLTFRPGASGSRSASLSITDSASGSPHTVSLTGTGVGVTVSPSSLAFGNQARNTTSSARTVTLTNVGTTTLTGINISITGSSSTMFSQTNTCGTSRTAGTSCTISVTFRPTSTGSKSATLNIVNSDPTSPQQVTLTGNGT